MSAMVLLGKQVLDGRRSKEGKCHVAVVGDECRTFAPYLTLTLNIVCH